VIGVQQPDDVAVLVANSTIAAAAFAGNRARVSALAAIRSSNSS
jgi:hypothetical protein